MTNQYLPTNINSPRNPRETGANLILTLDDEFVIITANAPQITLPTAVQIPISVNRARSNRWPGGREGEQAHLSPGWLDVSVAELLHAGREYRW